MPTAASWLQKNQFISQDEKSVYQRAHMLLKGRIVGRGLFEGRAHYEEFVYAIVNNITASKV